MVSVADLLALRNMSSLEMFQRLPELFDFTKHGDGPNDWIVDQLMPAITAQPERLDPLIEGWRAAAESIVAHYENLGSVASSVEGTWAGEAASRFSGKYIPKLEHTLTKFHEQTVMVPDTLQQVREVIAAAKQDCAIAIEDFGKSVFGALAGGIAGALAGGPMTGGAATLDELADAGNEIKRELAEDRRRERERPTYQARRTRRY